MKAQGRPVSGMSMNRRPGWDRVQPGRGYVFNQDATVDAMARTVEFLRRN